MQFGYESIASTTTNNDMDFFLIHQNLDLFQINSFLVDIHGHSASKKLPWKG